MATCSASRSCSPQRRGFAQDSAQSELKLDLLPNEAWWGGAVTLGTKMPYGVAPLDINLDGDNRGNQCAPLLVSSKGRYVWCEKAFRFAFKDQTLHVTSAGNTFRYGQAGQNLRDAYRHAAKSFFPTDGKLPDRALFAMPQYNTSIAPRGSSRAGHLCNAFATRATIGPTSNNSSPT